MKVMRVVPHLVILFLLGGCFSTNSDRAGSVLINGRTYKRFGKSVRVSQMAPDFTALDTTFFPVRLYDLRNYLVVLNVIPGIDDEISRIQTLRLIRDATTVSPLVKVVTISMDQPMTQIRFCRLNGLKNVYMWSDLAHREFGKQYGLSLIERGVLSRAVIIVREDGRISHIDIPVDQSSEPDYAEALDILRQLL